MQVAKMPDGTLIVTMSPDEGAIIANILDSGCHYREKNGMSTLPEVRRARTIGSQIHDAACYMPPAEDPLNVSPARCDWGSYSDAELLSDDIRYMTGMRELHLAGLNAEKLRRANRS